MDEPKVEIAQIKKPSAARHLSSVVYSGFFLISVALILISIVLVHNLVAAPKSFQVPSTVVFGEEESVTSLINDLYQRGYIASPLAFKVFLKLSGQDTKIPAGDYYFDQRLNASQLAHRFATGDLNQTYVRITIPEGLSVMQIAELVEEKFPSISAHDFAKSTKKDEGYLFPDTYFFYPDASADEIHNKMKANYSVKTESLFAPLAITEKEQYKILILASLLEEEGKTLVDKKIIAGILLNRLEKGMPLQVDATINYIKGAADKVYFSDLEIDSAYNTYQNKGLPPGPISSPGLLSLEAAITPTPSKYIYYLTGDDGTFHYAQTFEEHVRNKNKYIK